MSGSKHQTKQNPHIIIIPPPFQGHINPSIQLTLKLASKGFTITFVNTHSTHHQITLSRSNDKSDPDVNYDVDDHIFAGAHKSGLDIRYETIGDGFPLSFDRSKNRDQFIEGRLHAFPAHVDELVGSLVASDHPPKCLIVDTFSSWGSMIARKYGLVCVSFWTQPALVLTLYYHIDLLKGNGHYGDKDNRKDNIDYIPGVKQIDPKDLMSFLQEADTSNVMHRVIDKAFADVKNADFIICNTVEELEPEPISALKAKQPTYTIGPLFPSKFTDRTVDMNLWSESDCTQWLNTKPRGSVLYVSFGSYAHSNKEDIKIIAEGLMLSGFDFLLVLRPGAVIHEVQELLPENFQENVGDKGLIVPWCQQNVVLSRYSIGGFLSHCGWNSILESIWCRVPLLCFPLLGDQPTNRKLVVDDWKIGINLCNGDGNKLGSSGEVAEKIKLLMTNDGAALNELRKAIEQVREVLVSGLEIDGSSQRNFDRFVEDVRNKIYIAN